MKKSVISSENSASSSSNNKDSNESISKDSRNKDNSNDTKKLQSIIMNKNKLSSPSTIEKKKRGVNWDENLSVMLVPSRTDYKDSGLASSMWWTGSDFQVFQQSAVSEIRLLSVFEGININAAKKKLYQPEPEIIIEEEEGEEENLSLNASNASSSDLFDADMKPLHSPGPRRIKSRETNFQFDDSSYFEEPDSEGLVPVARARTPSWDDYAASWQNVKMSDLRPLKYIERKSKKIKEEYGQGAHIVWIIFVLIAILLFVLFVLFPLIRMYKRNKINSAITSSGGSI